MEANVFEGKVVAVTGGASGIGLNVARKLIGLKAKVAIADLSAAPDELQNSQDVMFTQLDVSSREAVHNWVEEIVNKFGRLDGMAANAGISPLEGDVASDALYDKICAVNFTGVWNCGTEAYRQFKKQGGGGAIVTTSSGSAKRHSKGLTVYGATKNAVIALTEGWAVEWGEQGTRVNCVAPGKLTKLTYLESPDSSYIAQVTDDCLAGVTLTPLQEDTLKTDPGALGRFISAIPLGRAGNPSELAEAICFLLGEKASYITGSILHVDGGFGPALGV